MSWVSWLALLLSAVSCTISIRGYLRAKRQLAEAEETSRRVSAAIQELGRWTVDGNTATRNYPRD